MEQRFKHGPQYTTDMKNLREYRKTFTETWKRNAYLVGMDT